MVLNAYAAPATESRSELIDQKTNAKEENDDLDDEDEAVEKRRFRGVKRSDNENVEKSTSVQKEDSEENFEKHDGSSGHPKHRDVERLLKDTARVKGALKELMEAMRELDRRAKQREHKPEEAAARGSPASASASAGASAGAEKPTDEQAVPVPVAEGAAGAGEGAGAESRRSESVVDKVAMMAKRSEKRRSAQINVPLRWG